MNSTAMGIFVKEKDIALIWYQNELSGHKDSWEIENNREMGVIYMTQHSYSAA